ncbi:gamma-glutamylcyclotransferase family protein [Bradyrhizobium elkanii]|uniref:gamma-glutamylcyclotransferase family protein n=1 Tax=Bradyrhizobium elkanii TaxID=29448 RepID=UPI003513404E
MSFHYFAYGSNMLPQRLLDRCSSAKLIGIGFAANFDLEFSKPSTDGSGKATLVPAIGSNVPGALFEIDVSERDALDRHEGLGLGYRRNDRFVVNAPTLGSDVETSTYLATARDARLAPFDWYLAIVIAGALHHEVREGHIVALRSTRFVRDTKADRKTRIAAIQAMRDHGVDDFRELLGA